MLAPSEKPVDAPPLPGANADPGFPFAGTCLLYRLYNTGFQPVVVPGPLLCDVWCWAGGRSRCCLAIVMYEELPLTVKEWAGSKDDGRLGVVVMGTGQERRMKILVYDTSKQAVPCQPQKPHLTASNCVGRGSKDGGAAVTTGGR